MLTSNDLQLVFDKYREKYARIFQGMYPAKNNTGFPERNLSVNFSKAIEALYPSAYSWFEFQFGVNNNLHFDAVVVVPETKALFVVESKRFSNLKKKIEGINGDILRMNKVPFEYREEFETRIAGFADFTVYGVVLADVWTETKGKGKIRDAFANGSFVNDYLPGLIDSGSYFVCGFEGATNHQWLNDHYYLLSMVWKP